MPVASAAVVGGKVAKDNPQATALVLVAVGLGAYFLVNKAVDLVPDVIGSVGDAAVMGAKALTEGTGDFLTGVFGGAEAGQVFADYVENPADPGVLYKYDDYARFGDDLAFVMVAPGSYDAESPTVSRLEEREGGVLVQVVENPSDQPTALIYQVEAPSLAEKVGGYVGDTFTPDWSVPLFPWDWSVW